MNNIVKDTNGLIGTPIHACLEMRKKWELPDTLMKGTQALRDRSKYFLPQHASESDDQYKIRVNRSVLRNYFKRTVNTFVGKVFTTEPMITANDQIMSYLENVDLTGRHFHVFCREVFEEAVVKGLSFVLVDYPTAPENTTLAEERALNLRPYLVHIKPEQILGWKSIIVGGVQTLTQVRILETVYESCDDLNTFSEEIIQRVRVLEKIVETGVVQQRIWQKTRNEIKGAPEEWTLISVNVFSGMTEIPFTVFYTNRKDFFVGEPALEDLAWMNLEHFQIRSDQRTALSVASFPILVATGVDVDSDKIDFGPNKMLASRNAEAKFNYLESGGAHLAAGRAELEDLENAMRAFASQFELANKSTTATGRAIDAAESSASLKSWSLAFGDFAEEILRYMYMWAGIAEDTYSVTMDIDFGVKVEDNVEFDILLKANATGLLSKETTLQEFKRRGILDADFDVETEIAKLDTQAPSFAPPVTNTKVVK